MKNRKVLIRNSVFALLAVIVLLAAYNLPRTANKENFTVSETKTELNTGEADVSEPAAEYPSAAEDAEVPSPEPQEETQEPPSEDNPIAEAEENAPDVLQSAEVPQTPAVSAPPEEAAPEPQTEPYCTLSVRCDTILNNMPSLRDGKADLVPQNGIIYEERRVKFNPGESVFNVLQREMKLNKIHMEFVNAPMYGSAYIEGIGNLYEFDCGDLSGWMYKVNGVFPNYGCSQYKVSSGDKIEWVYTCDLGKDVGGEEQPKNGRKNETE
ncbi:MAG: DUF4430 domain-containing protein [Clostridia bacterium]|nr:DUF4430 domain-containing protein [Clostridia bacterium]